MSWLDENPNCARTYAAFRLVGDSLDPDATSRALELEPSIARAKGEEIPPGRTGPGRHQRTGVWSLSTENAVRSTSLERHLLYLLDAIEPTSVALGELQAAENLQSHFFCYWLSATGHGGPELSPGTLGRIAALRVSLGLDFYGPFDA